MKELVRKMNKEQLMDKEQLTNNLYDIIAEHIDELDYEDGTNIYLTDKNEICIELNNSNQLFILNAKESE